MRHTVCERQEGVSGLPFSTLGIHSSESVADGRLYQSAYSVFRRRPRAHDPDFEQSASVHGSHILQGAIGHVVLEGAFADTRFKDGLLLARRVLRCFVLCLAIIQFRLVCLHRRICGAALVHDKNDDYWAGHVHATRGGGANMIDDRRSAARCDGFA